MGRYSDCVNHRQKGTACLAHYSKLVCNTSGNGYRTGPLQTLSLSILPPQCYQKQQLLSPERGSAAGLFLLLDPEHSLCKCQYGRHLLSLHVSFMCMLWHKLWHHCIPFSPQALDSCTGWRTLTKWAVRHFCFILIVSIVTWGLI